MIANIVAVEADCENRAFVGIFHSSVPGTSTLLDTIRIGIHAVMHMPMRLVTPLLSDLIHAQEASFLSSQSYQTIRRDRLNRPLIIDDTDVVWRPNSAIR